MKVLIIKVNHLKKLNLKKSNKKSSKWQPFLMPLMSNKNKTWTHARSDMLVRGLLHVSLHQWWLLTQMKFEIQIELAQNFRISWPQWVKTEGSTQQFKILITLYLIKSKTDILLIIEENQVLTVEEILKSNLMGLN